MKNSNKLLTIILALAMVMSVMVMPVSAASAEPFSFVADFESEPDFTVTESATKGVGGVYFNTFDGGVSYDWVVDPLNSSNHVVKVTVVDATKINDNYGFYRMVSLDPNSWYFYTIKVLADTTTNGQQFNARTAKTVHNKAAQPMSATEWKIGNGLTRDYCDFNTTYDAEKLVTVAAAGTKTNGAVFYIDDITVNEIKLVDDKGIQPTGSIKVYAPEDFGPGAYYSFVNDGVNNIRCDGDAVYEGNGIWSLNYGSKAALNSNADCTLTIGYFAGYALGSAASDGAGGYIINGNNQMVFNFKTSVDRSKQYIWGNPYKANCHDGSFETEATLPEATEGYVTGIERCKEAAYEGNYGLKFTSLQAHTDRTLNWYMSVWDVEKSHITGTEAGQGNILFVSCYAKAAPGSGNPKIKMGIAGSSPNNNIMKVASVANNEVQLNENEWKKVTGWIELIQGPTAVNNGINLGLYLSDLGTAEAPVIYIDNYKFVEASRLDLNSSFFALTDYEEGKLNISLADSKTDNQVVYVAAAAYNDDNSIKDIKLKTVNLYGNNSNPTDTELTGITDEYKVFIWDNKFEPLNSVLSFE